MTTSPYNPDRKTPPPASAEETLRIVAVLPAPAGLEDRVHAALRNAPRRGRVLAWPEALRPQSGWMRTAAAAAIVFVVAGGGWGVYTRVEQNRPGKLPGKVIVMPRLGAPGGFSGANAVRTPQTLTGPIVNTTALPAQAQAAKKAAGKALPKALPNNGATNPAAQTR
jgi:hypothetical protein